MLHAVIMAGGAGTRFWPASRRLIPKQLLNLTGERTMIQATVDRLQGWVPAERTLLVTNRALVPGLRQQLPQLPSRAILGEPCKRDTAPCIGLAAAIVSRQDEQATMLVMPADHVIQPLGPFRAAVQQACQWVQDDPRRIVTFGIRPTYPAESFGYIERGEVMSSLDPALKGAVAHRVKMFREKPSAQVAAQYLAAGTFYWNSGIFVWNAQTILEALRTFEPAMHEQLRRIADALETAEFETTLDSEFARIAGKSIDYAVLERYDPVVVIEAPFAWDDVGSWCSLARLRETDEGGNTIAGRHLGLNSRGCIVRGEGEHLIVTVGLEDCIVVHTADATLVARKQDEESIRQVVQLLQERGWTEYL